MLGGVEEDDLVVPLGDRLALRDEAGGIVAAAFGGAGAAGRGAGIILRHPERDRRRARLELIADRRGDDEEMIFGRRLYPPDHQIGRAAWRERVGQYESI